MRSRRLVFSALAAVLMSCHVPSALADKKLFDPPKPFVDNWKTLTGKKAVGRIVKIEPWKKYESLQPCTVTEVCKVVVPLLQIATVEIAQSPTSKLYWIVTIPAPQKLQIGTFLPFEFPDQPKEMAQAVYDPQGKAVVPKCSWGKADPDAKTEGVICDDWSYANYTFAW